MPKGIYPRIKKRRLNEMEWWKTHRNRGLVTVDSVISFNRILQKYGCFETARRAVNWNKYTAEKVKNWIWGKKTPTQINKFCIAEKLNHFNPPVDIKINCD